jgi:hypothetical protein
MIIAPLLVVAHLALAQAPANPGTGRPRRPAASRSNPSPPADFDSDADEDAAADVEVAEEESLVPIGREPDRVKPPELNAQLLDPPAADALEGELLTLLEAVAASRGRRAEVVAAYWNLSAAVAEYHAALDHQARVAALPGRSGRGTGRASSTAAAERLAIEQAVVEARRTEAALVAQTAQAELAELLGRSPGDPLPLPADYPHVGQYRTYFEQVFAGRTPSARARLVERTLPLRRKAIDVHAAAVVAAQDAVDAAVDAAGAGDAPLESALHRLAELDQRRREFIAAVHGYNDDIAAYAFEVGGSTAANESLVRMMILRPAGAPAATSDADADSDAPDEQTYEDEPADSSAAAPAALDEAVGAGGEEPTPADGPQARSALRPEAEEPLDTDGWRPARPKGTDAPRGDRSALTPPGGEGSRPSRGGSRLNMLAWWQAFAVLDEQDAVVGETGTYAGLVALPPAKQASTLAAALHEAPAAEDATVRPLSLQDCLRSSASQDRRALIAAYWRACELRARDQALAEQVQQLDQLVALVVQQRNAAGTDRAMLDLQAARLAAEAAQFDNQAALTAAEWDLTRLTGRSLDGPWLLPNTPPHAGGYNTSAGAAAGPAARVAAALAQHRDVLQRRAAAVIGADAARATAVADYAAAARPLDDVLAGVALQTEETLDFLAAVTRYNAAIAEYASRTVPQGTGPDQFAAALVLSR